ncbi:MAG: GHKL domain-containing protein, partial [Deltaproteobacteria bacterium]|nr:GHKL domain-containing protein [Deltaproteobacteria bacterium]
GVMAAGMAHEINQPLNVIQLCADYFLKMLKKGEPIRDDDFKSLANDIVTNVGRAAGVIKHVRDFARQPEMVRGKININDPIRDVFKVLGNQLKVHQIELELDLALDMPYIMAEHNRLEQVFINLVTNAIDAMDEKTDRSDAVDSKKRLKITSFAENGMVVVTVSDTGVGMPDEVKSKIFEPFFTTKKIGKGTGLGVSISYGIVKDYDGTIEIESDVGKGATFKISFPCLS